MIKVGTVFSGIGAFEHALKRMNIEHEIVFACDNGDVDILSKKISASLEDINDNFQILEDKLKSIEIDESLESRKEELNVRLFQLKEAYSEFCENTVINMEDKKIVKKIRDFSERLSMYFFCSE